jgi:hypothetical protein
MARRVGGANTEARPYSAPMTSVSSDAKQRASDKIAWLAQQGLDLVSLWRASTEALTGVVPYDFAPCWFTLDPASLLVTSHFDEGVPELPESQEGEVESATPGVERWLAALPDGDLQAGKLPSAVLAVAGQALRTAEHPHQPGEVAVSRVLSHSGTWVLLHGASLVSGGPRRVAVIVEPAHPAGSHRCRSAVAGRGRHRAAATVGHLVV